MIQALTELFKSLTKHPDFYPLSVFLGGLVTLLASVIGWPLWSSSTPPQPISSAYPEVLASFGAGLMLASIWLHARTTATPGFIAKFRKQLQGYEPERCEVHVFPQAVDLASSIYLNDLTKKCDGANVTLVGIGLAALRDAALLDHLLAQVVEGKIANLHIILAQPQSPAVRMRLVEEQCSERPPAIGLDGLELHIRAILAQVQSYDGLDPKRVQVSLFSHCPTFAVLKVGTNYLVYSYAYGQLGNFSAALCFDHQAKALATFYESHIARVKKAAFDAAAYFEVRGPRTEQLIPSLYGFAVYVVPDGPLYAAGSEILGFDVRSGGTPTSPFAQYVGEADEFGFHLTIADALYVADPSTIECIDRVVRDLWGRIGRIEIEYALKEGFPDESSISLVCIDRSGSLREFHRHLVERIYPLAIGSNYDLGSATTDRCYCGDPARNDQDRARAMIDMYHAPYILDCFKPHFTLLTRVPPTKTGTIAEKLQQEFPVLRSRDPITITEDHLFVMRRPKGSRHWEMPS